jgi:hypothetical protein
MKKTKFHRFADALERLGKAGVNAPEFSLGKEGVYELRYIPFEHVNRDARLVIVGITPGPNQLELAYTKAQALLQAGAGEATVLAEVIKTGGFGGPAMRPNLLKMLRHFHFDKLLGIDDVATLWGENAHLLHSTSVVPHALFEKGEKFSGSFDAILKSPMLKQCFLDCFVGTLGQLRSDALYVGLGDCPQAALAWCVSAGCLRPDQVLGAFCHPSTNGGSAPAYYLRERSIADLKHNDPVRHRAKVLDAQYGQMLSATSALLQEMGHAVRPRMPLPAGAPGHADVVPGKKQPAHRRAQPIDEVESGEIKAIVGEITRAGCTLTKETKKVVEFETRSGQVAYLLKERSALNHIVLIVDPKNALAELRNQAGITAVTDTHRFHAHMGRFPARINKGKDKTPYGWQVFVESNAGLQCLLASF